MLLKKINSYIFITIVVILHITAQTIVSDETELQAAISSSVPGSVIVLEDGVWTDLEIDIDKQGTFENPITIKAQTQGAVFFEGNSSVHLGGSYLHFEGVIFQNASGLVVSSDRIDPIIEFRTSSSNECNNCKVTNIKIDSFNGSEVQNTAIFKWIIVYGQHNEISYCSFLGKNGIGSIINDNRNDTNPDYTLIHHNYFAGRTPVGDFNDLNDQDAIRIGNSSTSLSDSFTEVYNNYFNNFSGEIEIISNKSGANKYFNNTFRNYQGSLTLRHGNGNEVYGNYFFANNNNTTAGIRVIGEDQLVYNNYIEGINSRKSGGSLSGATGGINVSNGRVDTQLNGYYQVKNTTLVNNTFVDCDYAIRIGTKVSSDLSLAPENLIVANNIMLNSSDKAISITTAPIGTSAYEGNITQNGSWDITTGNDNNIESASGLLADDGSFHRVVSGSDAIDHGQGTYSFLDKDLLGGSRTATFDAGAEELGSGGDNLPYSNDDIGIEVGFIESTVPEVTGALYLSEIMFNKDNGSNLQSGYQFIEIRGTPNETIPNFTYVVFIEGDVESSTAGKVKWWFDISNLSIGSNGYLVIRQSGSPYSIAEGATVVTGTSGFNGLDFGSYEGSGDKDDIESLSQNILLINTGLAVSRNDVYDIRVENVDRANALEPDGVPDASWTILDQISSLDDDGIEVGYGPLIFHEDADADDSNLILENGSNLIQNSFKSGYLARVGSTEGATSADWMGGQLEENAFDLGQYVSLKNETIAAYADLVITEIGGPNFGVTYQASSFSPTNPSAFLDLEIGDNLTTIGDIDCFDLTINANSILTLSAGNTLSVNGSLTIHGTLIVDGNLNVDGSITVESGASLITNEGNSIGSVTIKRNTRFSNGSYSFVGSPVKSDEEITGSDLGTTSYYYDEKETYSETGGNRWKNASSIELVPGIGYAQAFQGPISFTGIPNDGIITVSNLTYSAGTANEQGWNLLSNPYPAAISATAFMTLNTDLSGSIYLWDDQGTTGVQGTNADYLTVNDLGSVGSGPNGGSYNGNIGSMQGFFVKVDIQGTVDAIFNENMRVNGGNSDANFFRAKEEPTIKLAIESLDGKLYNETLIGLRNDATLGYDRRYDGPKLSSNNFLNFYSLMDDVKYSLQGLPVEEGVSAELAFDLEETSDLKFSVIKASGLEQGKSFYLVDKLTKNIFNLSEMESFTFSSVNGSNQNRFSLIYNDQAPLSLGDVVAQPIYRYLNKELKVSFSETVEIEEYMVYSLSGKIILRKNQSEASKEVAIPISHHGINIVKIVTSKGTFIRKFDF